LSVPVRTAAFGSRHPRRLRQTCRPSDRLPDPRLAAPPRARRRSIHQQGAIVRSRHSSPHLQPSLRSCDGPVVPTPPSAVPVPPVSPPALCSPSTSEPRPSGSDPDAIASSASNPDVPVRKRSRSNAKTTPSTTTVSTPTIENQKSKIENFLQHLSSLRILDPACGSGYFLYVAIQQLLTLEKEVLTFARISKIVTARPLACSAYPLPPLHFLSGRPRTVRTVPPSSAFSYPPFGPANPLPPLQFHSAGPRTVRTNAQVGPSWEAHHAYASLITGN
jgi:hypothetical protein